MLDVVWRELADFTIEMHRPIIHKDWRVEFEYDAFTWESFQWTRGAYLIEALEAAWLSYDTFDKSRLSKPPKTLFMQQLEDMKKEFS